MAAGSLRKPGCTSSLTVTVEEVGAAVVHWRLAKPSAPVTAVAVAPSPSAGSTHSAGSGETSAVSAHPSPGTSASTAGSGSMSTTFSTFTDGAHSWKAASRRASSRRLKSASR